MQIVSLLFCSLMVLVFGCSDNRPYEPEAKARFEQLYPGVVVTSVRISEDEVIARSFKFVYKKPGETTEKEIEIQFMQTPSTKQWDPRPEPPKELP